MQINTKIVSCHTPDSKSVKQEVNGTVILPPLVFLAVIYTKDMEEEGTLEAFRLDVATFRKTRHENLILFMGACMNPPKLAIVTSGGWIRTLNIRLESQLFYLCALLLA